VLKIQALLVAEVEWPKTQILDISKPPEDIQGVLLNHLVKPENQGVYFVALFSPSLSVSSSSAPYPFGLFDSLILYIYHGHLL